MATANNSASNITVFTNNGNGTYGIGITYPIGIRPDSITSADFNGDGKADLTTANYTANNITVFTNNGNGTYGIGVTYPTIGAGPRSVISADFNSDGKTDLATANSSGNNITVFTNIATPILTSTNNGYVGIGTASPLYNFQVNVSPTVYGYVASSGAWSYSSDSRVKKDISTLENSLDKVMALNAIRYNLISDVGSSYGTNLGFIAQEMEEIIPEVVGTDANGYKSIAYSSLTPILAAAIQEQQYQIEDLKNNLSLTSTGEINVDYNLSSETLASLGYSDIKNEIETASYSLTDSLGAIASSVSNFNQIASSKIKAGLVTTTNLLSQNIVTENILSPKGHIDHLVSLDIQTTSITADQITTSDLQSSNIDTDTITAKEATLSTLYADNIISKEGSIGELMTAKVSALRDELKKLVTDNQASSSAITGSTLLTEASTWSINVATDSAKINGDLELSNNLVVGAKLTILGDTQLANAFISGTFTAGEIAIKDNFIETTNTALYIQPSNTGSVHIMADTLVIAQNGEVEINGNLTISGSLMASLIVAEEIQTNKLTSLEIGSSILNSTQITSESIKIATDSAQSLIVAGSVLGQMATSSAELISNATAGTSLLPAGKSEIIINNNKITPDSMVYLTPVGSTNNQVPYLKAKVVNELDSYFIIAIDQALESDISINWWIIN